MSGETRKKESEFMNDFQSFCKERRPDSAIMVFSSNGSGGGVSKHNCSKMDVAALTLALIASVIEEDPNFPMALESMVNNKESDIWKGVICGRSK